MPPKEHDKSRGDTRRNRRRNGRSRGNGVSAAARGDGGQGTVSAASATPPEDNTTHDTGTCSVCTEPAKDWAVGICGHAVCGGCSHRMRILYKRKACVMCISSLEEVTVVPAASFVPGTPYAEVRALSTAHDSEVGMHFVDPARRKELQDIRGFKCSVCARIESSASKLRAHARSSHASLYCDVCFLGGSAFVSELPLYPLAGERGGCPTLREHSKKMHPMCRFCRKNFLNDDMLYAHLQEVHESCFICEREGRLHEYYRSFAQLEAHYMTDHFICRDPGCRAVVFATKADLKAHEVQRHMTGVPRNARRVRVELDDLGPRVNPEQELREERNRQSARRRAFMSSQVIFTGSTDEDRRGDDGAGPSSNPRPSRGSEPPPAASIRPETQRAAQPERPHQSRLERNANATRERRAADDDNYYASPLPQTQLESNQRSTVLVRRMRTALDPAAFEQFRTSSGQFRNGAIDASAYYNVTVESFGVRNAIRDFLPELIALLPDADKREALAAVVTRRRNDRESGHAPSSHAPSMTSQEFPSLDGIRPGGQSLTPIARGLYLPVPQANDFPRLNRVNKPTGADVGATSSAGPNAAQRQVPNMRRVFGAPTVPASATGRAPLNLRQATRAHPRVPTQALAAREAFPALGGSSGQPSAAPLQRNAFPSLGGGSSSRHATFVPTQRDAFPSLDGGRNSLNGVQAPVQQDSFPSLSAGNPSRNVAPNVSAPQISAFPSLGATTAPSAGAAAQESGLPDVDVTNRVGPVWGNSSQGSRQRRGATGRVPAPFPGGAGPSESKRAVVVDVMEVARERRKKIDNSALPKVGGSGYGFAWERKKHAKKKKELKASFASSGSDSDSIRAGNSSGTQAAGSSTGHSFRAHGEQPSNGDDAVLGFEDLSVSSGAGPDQGSGT